MASGKKNYFRHSFFARNDSKLLHLKDAIGVGYYFYYFSLLELCGEQSSDELRANYCFHNSLIRKLWCCNLKKCERIGIQMNAVGLLLFNRIENNFYFEIPNFSKYLGKYTNKIESNTPNKRKEKKRKEKKIKVNSQTTFDAIAEEIIDYLNKKTGKQFNPTSKAVHQFLGRLVKQNYELEQIKLVIDHKSQEWKNDLSMNKYLRPETLFGNKFDSYLANAANSQKPDMLDQFFQDNNITLYDKKDFPDESNKNSISNRT